MGYDSADGGKSGKEAGECLSKLIGTEAGGDEAKEGDSGESGEDSWSADGPKMFSEN